MENAAQALIIAGAILLAVLIIALGMFIFQQARNQIQNVTNQLDTHVVNAHNSRIEQYTGRVVGGSQVKSMIKEIRTATIQTDDPYKTMVDIEVNGVTGIKNIKRPENATIDTNKKEDYVIALTNFDNAIPQNARFKVESVKVNAKNGFIEKIKVSRAVDGQNN